MKASVSNKYRIAIRSLGIMMLFLLWQTTALALPIVIVGDSLSAGYGIDPNKGWVNLLRQRLQENHYKHPVIHDKYPVINASVSGDTTANGLNRLPNLLKRYPKAVYIIELGGNDGLQGLPISLIKQNLSQMISLIKQHKNPVILIGVRIPPSYGEKYTRQLQALFPEVAKQHNIPIVPLFLDGIDSKREWMQDDGIHPKAIAQTHMLDNVWKVLWPIVKTYK